MTDPVPLERGIATPEAPVIDESIVEVLA